MKKLGTAALVFAAFIGGMAFVYSCGGSGSESNAQDLVIIESKIDALALYVENMDAKIDSLLIHAQDTESRLNTLDSAVSATRSSLDNTVIPAINSIKSVVDDIKSFLGA